MKLLIIQKHDLQIIITCCYSIIIIVVIIIVITIITKEYPEGIFLRMQKCIHLAHPFVIAIVKVMSIQNVYRFC